MLAVVMPLWANYLVRVFAWKALLEGGGPAAGALADVGLTTSRSPARHLAMWMTFCYLWLPYAILPIYASLERVPPSLTRGFRRPRGEDRHDVPPGRLPARGPGVVAGSIFTFSLTLGDYIVAGLVGKGTFIGNGINALNLTNLPLAATIAVLPLIVIFVYLALARRTGAFEAL